jgi:pimeloyl-ACP methyl ester carboxylesterase
MELTVAGYRAVRPAGYAEVPPVAVPTTYLWGEHDLGVSPAAALGCAAHVDAEVVRRATGGRQSSER